MERSWKARSGRAFVVTGTLARGAGLVVLRSGTSRITLNADKTYDLENFVGSLREPKIRRMWPSLMIRPPVHKFLP